MTVLQVEEKSIEIPKKRYIYLQKKGTELLKEKYNNILMKYQKIINILDT